jgi:hypothetical protein
MDPKPVGQKLSESLGGSGRVSSLSPPSSKANASVQSAGVVGAMDPQPVGQKPD